MYVIYIILHTCYIHVPIFSPYWVPIPLISLRTQAWWQGHLKKKHESQGSMSWSELNTSLTWQCMVPAKFCLVDPIAPLPILHLQGVCDISTLITAEHKRTWVALKDVVSEGEEALERLARAKPPTQTPPKLPVYARLGHKGTSHPGGARLGHFWDTVAPPGIQGHLIAPGRALLPHHSSQHPKRGCRCLDRCLITTIGAGQGLGMLGVCCSQGMAYEGVP